MDYLNGSLGYKAIAKKYGIKSHSNIIEWVKRYEKQGLAAFHVQKTHSVYGGDFKLEVLEWMKRTGSSYLDTAIHFNIPNSSTVHRWWEQFEEEGVEALYHGKGRPPAMNTPKKSQKNQKRSAKDAHHLTEMERLEKENRLLRIENEYLKKMRALIQKTEDTDKSKRK